MADPGTTGPDEARSVVLGVSLKLYMDVATTLSWAEDVARMAARHPAMQDGRVTLFVLPSLPALTGVQAAFGGTPVKVGAQDLHWADRGAFTGAVSGADLREVGCALVEVGHAERRSVFGEGEGTFRLKMAAAVRNGLTPVLCVGERVRTDAADAAVQCCAQLAAVLEGIDDPGELIVAYEPEWAIGSTEPASAEHVAVVAAALRRHVISLGAAASSSVIYGGSAQPGTLRALAGQVDGLFLGRFAHDPDALAQIIDEAALA
ncbi:triose-phosphate isomerase family protein [Microbacterium sp. Marseille-Q6648]|uniref:triose-phosphate isomerase family protein n=1 Tax=Microbacterium sp. Marseille-Q6648 TaxID=2937991 RepID=UPI00203FC181|nr:triose-phosphate isomerase family protein [Microbacterium sp. Marseille-Q6648]